MYNLKYFLIDNLVTKYLIWSHINNWYKSLLLTFLFVDLRKCFFKNEKNRDEVKHNKKQNKFLRKHVNHIQKHKMENKKTKRQASRKWLPLCSTLVL